MQKQNEIIFFPTDTDLPIEVRIDDETVWLNRNQLAILFNRDVKTIGKHIVNVLKEELKNLPVVAKFATTGTDGKQYQVEHYNLDMIISIGYRVKSTKGIQFRIWANKVLKDYLLKGYAIHRRIENIERKMEQHDQQIAQLVHTALPAKEGIFFDGQIFDAYEFVSQIIKNAKENILLIDNYIDETTLNLLAKRKRGVTTIIYTAKLTHQLKIDLDKYHTQYEHITIKILAKSHDRFLIVDHKEVYHIGASLKDLGKKWFAFSKINQLIKPIIEELNKL